MLNMLIIIIPERLRQFRLTLHVSPTATVDTTIYEYKNKRTNKLINKTNLYSSPQANLWQVYICLQSSDKQVA